MTSSGQGGGVRPRRRRDPGGTRSRLVRAAVELFTTQGYHASTTPMIARRAGVAEGTIYRHFSSKRVLLNEIYRHALGLFSEPLATYDGRTSCLTGLKKTADHWRDLAVTDPAAAKLVFVQHWGDLLDDESQRARKTFKAQLESVVASGKSNGEVRTGPADVWSEVWLQGMVLVVRMIAEGSWRADQSQAALASRAAWDAIAARG